MSKEIYWKDIDYNMPELLDILAEYCDFNKITTDDFLLFRNDPRVKSRLPKNVDIFILWWAFGSGANLELRLVEDWNKDMLFISGCLLQGMGEIGIYKYHTSIEIPTTEDGLYKYKKRLRKQKLNKICQKSS